MRLGKPAVFSFCLVAVGASAIALNRPALRRIVGKRAARFSLAAEVQDANQPQTAEVDAEKVPEQVTNFLGDLTPGGAPDAAGHGRNYVVTYQVDFLRKTPDQRAPEESLSYAQLRASDADMPPFVYFGETVEGKYDPAHPDVIAVHATIEGKETSGYIDARKLWLEPPVERAASDRYMAIADTVNVHVVSSATSPAVVTLLQGEVVDAVGALNFRGRSWVKARFNATERPRFGFIPGNELEPLTVAFVDQSAITLPEVPKRIRGSNLKFAAGDRGQLARDGFYIEQVPPLKELSVDDMADAYAASGGDGEQFFITSDLFLHSYHLIFDRMLQDMEEKKFLPAAIKLTDSLARTTEAELGGALDCAPAHREALQYDLLYFSVAAKVLDPAYSIPAVVRPQAEALVARINAGDGELPSTANFLGLDQEDFTQYKVRGHYAKDEALSRYFRGMMWYGRRNFLLSNQTQTLAAILLPHLLQAAHAAASFDTLDAQITYLIGRQDKYTVAGYRSVNRKVFGSEAPACRELNGNLEDNLEAFQRTAWSDLPAPRIVSVQTGMGRTQQERLRETAGLKFLGQRFVLDAFILNQLTSPSVGSDQNPRNLPSALDVLLLLGSKAAGKLQQQAQKEHWWANYDAQIAKIRNDVAAEMTARSTFYDQYLYSLSTLFLPGGSRQMFMLREPWQYKTLNTAGAAWTELKHDTILYAEQSEAEMGAGSEFEIPPYVPPPPKGYVEPNPRFFDQLTASIDQMLGTLKASRFLPDEYADKFTTFRQLAHRAGEISQKEVSGQPISPDDYDWIRNLRYSFNGALLLPRGADIIKDTSLLQMALVTDVATDAVDGLVLEEGIGTPQRIVVAVKDVYGGTRLTIGYVYSWYEFSSSRRQSDADWKKMIYGGGMTSRSQGVAAPQWYAKFLRSAD